MRDLPSGSPHPHEGDAEAEAVAPAPTGLDVPVAGRLFIDDAIARIKELRRLPEGPAMARLMDALRSGEIRSWQRVIGFYREKESRPLTAHDWESARIDLDEFRRSSQGGIDGIEGRRSYLHRVVISEEDFQFWLERPLGPAGDAAPTMARSAPRRTGGEPVKRAYKKWANETHAATNKPPTRREAEQWAKNNNHSTSVVREAHSEMGARGVGRPPPHERA